MSRFKVIVQNVSRSEQHQSVILFDEEELDTNAMNIVQRIIFLLGLEDEIGIYTISQLDGNERGVF